MRYSPPEGMRHGLIDGDIILYACAWVAEKEEASEEESKRILDRMLLNMRHTLELDSADIFLSDSDENNFREKVAVTHKYKGNRDKSNKPECFGFLKQYMIDEWEAEIVKDAEADDGMGLGQTDTTLICTIDKDLDMIAGWHYNWKKFAVYHVDEFTAKYNFWRQMLTGDSTDNIVAIPKVGKVRSERLLADCTTELQMFNVVKEQYIQAFGAQAQKRYEENYDLLMIRGANVSYRDAKIICDFKQTKKKGMSL